VILFFAVNPGLLRKILPVQFTHIFLPTLWLTTNEEKNVVASQSMGLNSSVLGHVVQRARHNLRALASVLVDEGHGLVKLLLHIPLQL